MVEKQYIHAVKSGRAGGQKDKWSAVLPDPELIVKQTRKLLILFQLQTLLQNQEAPFQGYFRYLGGREL